MQIPLHQICDKHADVCVIGGGAVGIPMAVYLARAGLKVIVLEAGSNQISPSNQKLMEVEQPAKQFRTPTLDRYRVLGGGTTFWGGQIFELGEHILDSRPHLPAWPISSEDLRPWYERAAELIGLDPRFNDEEVWQKVGHPSFSEQDQMELVLSRWVPIRNFSALFRNDLQHRDNLYIATDSTATAFELSGPEVRGVQVRDRFGKTYRLKARHFVLAAGTIENARLLLNPGSDGEPYPWSSNTSLGKYFCDHIGVEVGRFSPAGTKHEDFFDAIRIGGRKYWPKLRLKPSVQLTQELLDAACEFSFDNRIGTHLSNIKLLVQSLSSGTLSRSKIKSALAALSAVTAVPSLAARYIRDHRIGRLGSGEASVKMVIEQFPNSESAVELTNVRDASGLYKAFVNWKLSGKELNTLRFCALSVRDYVEKHQLGTITLDPRVMTSTDYLERFGFDTIHQMGTTRMAADETSGVVDSFARVFRTENLYVAGAAVFPAGGFANPTFGAIAIALRTAAHIRDCVDKELKLAA